VDTNCLISYKINNKWIIVNDIKLIPETIQALKIEVGNQDYIFEGFDKIGLIYESSITSYPNRLINILWVNIYQNNELLLYKITNNGIQKIPLINKNGKSNYRNL